MDKLKIIGANGEKECRYGLFDFEYTHQCQGTQEVCYLYYLSSNLYLWLFNCFSSQGKKEKLFLMSWCPDDAKVKKKMLYSSSFDALKKALVGVAKYIQVNNLRKYLHTILSACVRQSVYANILQIFTGHRSFRSFP